MIIRAYVFFFVLFLPLRFPLFLSLPTFREIYKRFRHFRVQQLPSPWRSSSAGRPSMRNA